MKTREWEVSQATEEDAEAMVQLTVRTLAAAETVTTQYKDIPTFVYPREREHLTSPEELFAHRVRTRRKVISSPGIRTYKVVHPSEPGRIIGALMRREPVPADKSKGIPPSEAEEQKPESQSPPGSPPVPPASLDQEAMRHVAETMESVQKEIWGGDTNYLYLMVFEVDAEFRRQGIATQLMKPLFEQPLFEAGRLPIYVEASPLGKMFYKSCGFELLRDIEFFDGKAMLSAMICRREPKA